MARCVLERRSIPPAVQDALAGRARPAGSGRIGGAGGLLSDDRRGDLRLRCAFAGRRHAPVLTFRKLGKICYLDIQSCWTECSVLHHCILQIINICNDAEHLCKKHINSIQQQWLIARFDLEICTTTGFAYSNRSFFSGVKTLLDLIVQLLSSEKVVSGIIDGFHRTQGIYGGKVINALGNNVPNAKKNIATKMRDLISEHKAKWIDQAILARDQLVHPEKGMHQLMFQLNFAYQADKLVCVKVSPPSIGYEAIAIDQYATQVIGHVQNFSSSFLGLVKE